jgi:hypothetical protein
MRGGPRVVDETETALNSIQKKPLELKRLDWDGVEKNSAEASRGHATAAPCKSLTCIFALARPPERDPPVLHDPAVKP